MLAILSLPVLGLWTVLYRPFSIPSRMFRLYTVLITMLIMAGFVFLRQYLQDQTLIALLRNPAAPTTARSSSEPAGAEREACLSRQSRGRSRTGNNHPLNAIMSYSEELWTQERLGDQQNTLLRKIVNQAAGPAI